MYKKSLMLVSAIIFALCIFSGFVSATDTVKNTVSNVTNTVVDGTANLANDVREGVGNLENGIENTVDMNNMTNGSNNSNTINDGTRDDNTATDNNAGVMTIDNGNGTAGTDGYATTRTTADAITNDNTSTLWTWLIVAIAAIVIIGLVWYYGASSRSNRGE